MADPDKRLTNNPVLRFAVRDSFVKPAPLCYNAAVNNVLPKEVIAVTDMLRNKILSLLPSSTLKKQISLSDCRFSDTDLIAIVWKYAADYDERIALLQELEQCFSGELKEYTSKLVHAQRFMLDNFIKPDEAAVYELHIKTTPHAYDERYLCRSYDDALRTIPLFYQQYNDHETASTCYTIAKRRVMSGDMTFSEDELGELVLLPGMKVDSVDLYDYSHLAEGCGPEWDCSECNRLCVRCYDILFPLFVRHGDAVRVRYRDGEECFGIVFVFEDQPCSEYYVIPLDSNAVRYHDYINIYDAHRHVPAPLVEKISEEELPEKYKENYKACAQYVRKNVMT